MGILGLPGPNYNCFAVALRLEIVSRLLCINSLSAQQAVFSATHLSSIHKNQDIDDASHPPKVDSCY